MKKLFSILLLSTASVANAGFITGAVVGSALSGDSTTVKKYSQDTAFLGDSKDTYIVCTHKSASLCEEGTRVNNGSGWEWVCYTPEKYAKAHGYTKVLQKGLFFRGDSIYHIMRVEK